MQFVVMIFLLWINNLALADEIPLATLFLQSMRPTLVSLGLQEKWSCNLAEETYQFALQNDQLHNLWEPNTPPLIWQANQLKWDAEGDNWQVDFFRSTQTQDLIVEVTVPKEPWNAHLPNAVGDPKRKAYAYTLCEYAHRSPISLLARDVLASQHQISNAHVGISEYDVQSQSQPAGVAFAIALHDAVTSFLQSCEGSENPLELLLPEEISCDTATPEMMLAAKTRLHALMNQTSARFNILPLNDQAPQGELARDYWIVTLYLGDLSDHTFYGIVDRTGQKPAYNYGMN